MGRKSDKSPRDAVIARIAANQHGVVTTAQLTRAGLSSGQVSKRGANGRLHRVHRGVYAVGHSRLSPEGRWMAAVLACGDGAVLSHGSAAELWGIRRVRRLSGAGGRGAAPMLHVTVRGTGGRKKHHGIALHRSSTLDASECTRRGGIPVTSPTRTLLDLRPHVSPAEFAAAVREAEFLRLPIRDRFESEPTRSELEERFLALTRRHRLPRPAVNVAVDRYEVDFLWRTQRVIVEVDGWEAHRSRSAFEEDRGRDTRLKFLGYEVVRFTWRQIATDSSGVARAVRALLDRKEPESTVRPPEGRSV